MDLKISSTLSKEDSAVLKREIPVKELIFRYQNELQIDVKNYFAGVNKIGIYECCRTQYRFFFPLGLEGDSHFYQELQKLNWYYMPWKWEHDFSLKQVRRNDKILEIGSGGLGFVRKLKGLGFDIRGLEMNLESLSKAKELGLSVSGENIDVHSLRNYSSYDVVCCFQVMEHISDVKTFIKAQVKCLKPGGKLIISVPNNESFIKWSHGGILNFPPHHMGWWNENSLKRIAPLFNLKLERICFEPLQLYHLDYFVNSSIDKNFDANSVLGRIIRKPRVRKIYKRLLRGFRNKIRGHTILAIYTKN